MGGDCRPRRPHAGQPAQRAARAGLELRPRRRSRLYARRGDAHLGGVRGDPRRSRTRRCRCVRLRHGRRRGDLRPAARGRRDRASRRLLPSGRRPGRCGPGTRSLVRSPDSRPTTRKAGCRAAEHADLLWLESPSNPLLDVADLPAILSQPRKPGAIAVVDNTFATPLGQQPLELGADLVLHSATKYLGGHSDLMLGAAVARDDELADRAARATPACRSHSRRAGDLPRRARNANTSPAARTRDRHRSRARHSSGTPSRGQRRSLPRPADASDARDRAPVHAQLRSHDLLRRPRRRRPRGRHLRVPADHPARHQSRLRRIHDRTPTRPRASPARSTCHRRCYGSASAARTSKTSGQTSTAPSSGAGRRHVIDLTSTVRRRNPGSTRDPS